MLDTLPADFYQRCDGLTADRYQALYQQSLADPAHFWAEQAALIDFATPWQHVLQGDFSRGDTRWFSGATLNACYNCVDRHLAKHSETLALIWQGDALNLTQTFTYQQLHEQVCRLANVLKTRGVAPGDRVGIYLPMIPEAVIAMLACARIGAVHCVVFAGFSAESLAQRFNDIACRVVISADVGWRGGKVIPLKQQLDLALDHCPLAQQVLIVQRSDQAIVWLARDSHYQQMLDQASSECACVAMPAEAPLFILHTSGSTGQPKGVVHGTAGYLLYTALSFKILFDYQVGEVYWCTADIGWITGHSYGVYGPLANAATVLLFEGIPTFPDAGRYWQIIDQYQVAIFYTAPTAIRALMREGDTWLKSSRRTSLRLLGSVGEPINPLVWWWYFEKVGLSRCPIIDTWWQTETGGILLAPIIGITPLKPGSVGRPFWGIEVALIDEQQRVVQDRGNLVIARAWPGLMQTIYGDSARFIASYFAPYPGFYLAGDGAWRDVAGDYRITGRIDDVLNCSGHRIGTAEVESALMANAAIAEAAVVGFPQPIKGEGIYAFVTPKVGIESSEALKQALLRQVTESIGAIAKPDFIQFAVALPKTRSGKIMRRLLKKIAAGDAELGDISTLADPSVVDRLVAERLY